MGKLLRKINFKLHEKEFERFTYVISLLYVIVEARDFLIDNDKWKAAFYDTVVALQRYNESIIQKGELSKNDLETIRISIKNLYENYDFIF